MSGDPGECSQRAKLCLAMASATTNPALKDSFLEMAQRWSRLAADLDAMNRTLEAWSSLNLQSREIPKHAGAATLAVNRAGTR
jgi:hypothetical protein